MKKVLCAVSAVAVLATSSTAFAEATSPLDSLNAIQSTGVELTQEEMSELRGEWGVAAIRAAINALNQDNIQAFRQALGLNSCDWLCNWAIQSPQAVIAWLNSLF